MSIYTGGTTNNTATAKDRQIRFQQLVALCRQAYRANDRVAHEGDDADLAALVAAGKGNGDSWVRYRG